MTRRRRPLGEAQVPVAAQPVVARTDWADLPLMIVGHVIGGVILTLVLRANKLI